jgi:biotin carboxyl carrier protein
MRYEGSVSEPPAARATSLGNGRFELVDGSRRRTAYAVKRGAETWVFLDGEVHVISSSPGTAPGRRAHAVQDDEAALAAPMPATVVSIAVTAGDRIARGDVLMTLEAMKMEMAIRAPRDGIVRRIACQAGELVQAGVPLIELE